MCLLRCREQCRFYRNCHFSFFFSPGCSLANTLEQFWQCRSWIYHPSLLQHPLGHPVCDPRAHRVCAEGQKSPLLLCPDVSVSLGCWKPPRPRINWIYQWWQDPVAATPAHLGGGTWDIPCCWYWIAVKRSLDSSCLGNTRESLCRRAASQIKPHHSSLLVLGKQLIIIPWKALVLMKRRFLKCF